MHPDGGLNTLYGREPELDVLAREFMAAVGAARAGEA